jgi:hypothetical protein
VSRVDDHVALANRTHETLECLIAAGPKHSPWIATVAFYKALHVIEAMFATLSMRRSTSHDDRERQLRSQRRFDHIFKHYRSLQTTALIARYLSDTKGQAFKSFEDYMPGSTVLSEVVHHRLQQVEVSATKLMAPHSPAGLVRCSALPNVFAVAPSQQTAQQAGGSAAS